MRGIRQWAGRPAQLTIEAYGVRVGLSAERPAVLDLARTILPPGSRECANGQLDARFELVNFDAQRCDVIADGRPVVRSVETAAAIGRLDAQIRAAIATRTPEWVFVHAGVVAIDGRAIVIPGASFSGKTTLVSALIEAGATYLSDEYAVLDANGRVHPYPKPLSIRDGRSQRATTETAPLELGAQTATASARIALIALTSYKPDVRWEPRAGTTADAALALFSHAVLARRQPQRVLRAVSSAAAGTQLLEGDRGEARPSAHALLNALTAQRPAPTRRTIDSF